MTYAGERTRCPGPHVFPSRPADNQPAVTEAIKGVLQEHYNYDSTVRLCSTPSGPLGCDRIRKGAVS